MKHPHFEQEQARKVKIRFRVLEHAQKPAHFTGLTEDYLIKANLRVSPSQFDVELQRSRGLTIGRLDSRYSRAPDISR